MQGIVGGHPVGAGAHGLQGKARLPLQLPRQHGRHRFRQQVEQPGIRAVEMQVQGPWPGALQPDEVGEQRPLPQGQQALHHVLHRQFAAVVEAHRWPQIEAPVTGAEPFPVVGEIPLDFPIFLISPGQAVEDLAAQVHLGAAQGVGGKQPGQRAVIGHPQDLAPLPGSLAELLDEQRGEQIQPVLRHPHRLGEQPLLQQIPQPASGQVLLVIEQSQPGAAPPPRLGRPAEPALILHTAQQQTGVARGAAQQLGHLGEADLPLVGTQLLGESLKLLMEATGRHKRGNPW
ncbi:hypothetical protein D3C77_408630 [compost metagenome]